MMVEMSSKRLGCVISKDSEGKIAGIFCDGDLRRLIETSPDREIFGMKARDVMLKNPRAIRQDALLEAALALMEKNKITQLPTVDENDRLAGVIPLHDILKSKLV
ncbi:MAG: hypothetical protein DRP45_04305 [Candidatus Zixiibacteriota bacterium]|nr:MAG: hypothetical protein DRP45_04305 [candidate division Zixibacteria bacterium]